MRGRTGLWSGIKGVRRLHDPSSDLAVLGHRLPQGEKDLRQRTSVNLTGVPTWAIYAGDSPRFIPVDKPTASTVIAELDAAGITEKVAKAGR